MGQKVNPIGLRLQIIRTWSSRWYTGRRDYADKLHQDLRVRRYLFSRLKEASVSRVDIERAANNIRVNIHAARPGAIIGKKGSEIETLKKELSSKMGNDVSLNIIEVRKPEIDAQLVAAGIAAQLERRVSFRRAMKRAVQSALRLGVQGIRVNCAGRLAGAEIARTEWYREGRVPLHTLRADIDYGFAEAHTTYGIIGVKIWLFKGEIMAHDPMGHDKQYNEQQGGRARA